MNSASIEQVVEELQSIKRLLALGLLKSGSSQTDLANALGVNQSSISRMFPKTGATSRPDRQKRRS
jgi:predicted transcriptional regulator